MWSNQNPWSAKAVGLIGPPARAGVPALISLLDDRSVDMRAFAAEALGRMAPHACGAVFPLELRLKDVQAGEGWAREHCREALQAIRRACP